MASIKKYISYGLAKVSGQLDKSQRLNQFYKDREWGKFDDLISECKPSSEVYLFWKAMKDNYFMVLDKPADVWRSIYLKLSRKEHFLTSVSFRNFINALIVEGKFDELKKELPKLANVFNTHIPVNSLTWVGALYVKNEAYQECLDFFNETAGQLTGNSRDVFELRTYPYYWLCHHYLNDGHEILKHSISEGLRELMIKKFQTNSAAYQVFEKSISCWDKIVSESPQLLLELRYMENQINDIRNRVFQALKTETPLLLLRLGDGEAYAFADENSEDEADIIPTLEKFWWATNLDSSLREGLIKDVKETIRDADIIGLPYTIRLSQTLSEFKSGKLSYSDRRQKILFQGVERMLDQNEVSCSHWVDEYCNYAFVKEDVLREMIQLAKNVVLVGCFNIPEGSIFSNSKVEVIQIPPVQKISEIENVMKSDKSLPEILKEIEGKLEPKLSKGSLLLLAGGFAGKPLLKVAKDKGAVAIDFGSGIDHVLGYKTRSQELHLLFD